MKPRRGATPFKSNTRFNTKASQAGQAGGSFYSRAIGSLLICAWLTLFATACGKVGAPVPPARLSERTSELTAIQRGGEVILTWPSPSLGEKESSRGYIARADIYRLGEQRDQEAVLDEDDYEESARIIGYLDRAAIESQIKSLGHLQFADVLNLTGSHNLANTRLRYAVRYVNRREQTAPFSNTVAVEPAPSVARPPSGLKASAPAQDEVSVTWDAPESNVDGSQPPSIIGYNLYRRAADSHLTGELLNATPIADTGFVDKTFDYNADYVYTVRALSQGANGLIESADGTSVAFKPVDTFPPSPPDPVSIASANGTISLFWPSSPERDVEGYNVYRSSSKDATGADWVKLNGQIVKTTTFHDDRVALDQTYLYKVTAVDRFKNESAPSRAVSETAHP